LAIVEDDCKQVALLEGYLERLSSECSHFLTWHAFESGEAFLKSFNAGMYDIMLLDIQLTGIDGMELAQRVRAANDQALYIFITNLVQCAIQGYSVQALDFLIKPIEYALFAQKLSTALECLKRVLQRKEVLSFKVIGGIVNLRPIHILYFEIVSRKTLFYTNSETYHTNEALGSIEQRLTSKGFYRCHTGYLVNIVHVRSIHKDYAVVGRAKVPVSKHRRKGFLDAVGNFLGNHA
jgi:DNA-binding LytR/AlgR family response regulator